MGRALTHVGRHVVSHDDMGPVGRALTHVGRHVGKIKAYPDRYRIDIAVECLVGSKMSAALISSPSPRGSDPQDHEHGVRRTRVFGPY